jgi:hypothetical protein
MRYQGCNDLAMLSKPRYQNCRGLNSKHNNHQAALPGL